MNVRCIYCYTEAKSSCSNSCSAAIPAIDWTQHDPFDRARVAARDTAAAGVPLMRQGERREEAERDRFCGGKVSMSWMERAGYMLDGELSIENLEKQLSSLYAAITSCGASPPHMPPPPPPPGSPLASAGPAVWGPGAWNPDNNGGIDRCAWDGQLQLP